MTGDERGGEGGAVRRLRERRYGFRSGLAVGTVVGVLGALVGTAWLGGDDDPWEPGELVILSGLDSSQDGVRQELIDIWNSVHPDHPARILELPAPADVQHSGMVGRAQAQRELAGPGPDAVDIYNLDVTWTTEFASAGYLRKIDESQLADPDLDGFVRIALETCRHDGALWALPFNTDAGLMFYRSDLLEPPGLRGSETLPRFDWDRVVESSRRLAVLRKRDPRLRAGYVGQFLRYEGLTVNGLEALWAGGIDRIVDEDADRVVFDRKSWERALARLAFQPAGAPGAGVLIDKDPLTYDEIRGRTAFQDGWVLFMRNWPVHYRYLTADSLGGRPPPEWVGVAKLPGPSALGGQNLAVAAESEQPRAAQALIEFLTNEVNQRRLFRDGGFAPTREAVYRADEANPYTALVRQAIGEARLRPRTPRYVDFSDEFQLGVQYAMQNGGRLPDGFEERLNARLAGR